MTLKKHIPNALTCCNLLCGCLGILFTANYRLDIAFYLVLIAGVFDFFDGFAARILKVSSAIGKDLDSLADMVTFGVLPGLIMFKMIGITVANYNMTDSIKAYTLLRITESPLYSMLSYFPFIAFIIPVFSALRLAKFNNDVRQSDSFIGVNTPANTILISSLGYSLFCNIDASSTPETMLPSWVFSTYFLIGLTVLMSFLLISELPVFALKFKNFSWADNKIRYVFLIIAMLLLILFQFFAFPFIIFLYIILSIIHNIITKKEKINS